MFKNPKQEYHGKIEDYPLENYPDYQPGRVIMPAQAKKTIAKVRKAGIDVVEFDASGLQVGTNGARCVTTALRRDVGPSLGS
ncbi:MAG: arginine deiminase family protein [Chloroflexota bacterium]|nr:arginine deiminase family protein [Chloroflexota bacterium]